MPGGPAPNYGELLDAVLRRRDPWVLQIFLAESAGRYGDKQQVAEVEAKDKAELEELMHRMIVARPGLGELHRASREWLSRHGVDTYGDGADADQRN